MRMATKIKKKQTEIGETNKAKQREEKRKQDIKQCQ